MNVKRNDVIDECISKIKSLIKPRCDDHTPYQGACVTCGEYYNDDVLPEPSDIIESLEQLKSKNLEYFLCSKAHVDALKPLEVSKPFKSGYNHDEDEDNDQFFVAKFERFVVAEQEIFKDFYIRLIRSTGTIDIDDMSLNEIKEYGLFIEIERKTKLSSIWNRASIIGDLSKHLNCTPIEFINKYC